MRNGSVVVALAILSVAGLEAYVLYLGHNGQLFAGSIGIIGLLAGAKVGDFFKR